MIIYKAAETYVPDKYQAIFVNKDFDSHRELKKSLEDPIKQGKVISINADAEMLLNSLRMVLKDQTLLIYLDPFGIKGCEFKFRYEEKSESVGNNSLRRRFNRYFSGNQRIQSFRQLSDGADSFADGRGARAVRNNQQ